MEQIWNIVFLVGGLVALKYGAAWLVGGAVRLALRAGLSPGLVGVTIVAFGTSAPELVSSVIAAIKGNVDLAYGNIIGSNIANIALVLGACSQIGTMRGDPVAIKWDGPWFLISALVLLFCVLTGVIGPNVDYSGVTEGGGGYAGISGGEGVLMVGLWVLFLATSAYRALRYRGVALTPEVQEEVLKLKDTKALLDFGVLALGLGVLTGGAYILVDGAVGLAVWLGIPELIVGLTIVAFGTSLPELFTSWVAAKKGHNDLAVANVSGSNIQNILLCLGASAVAAWIGGANGLPVSRFAGTHDLWAMLIVTGLLAAFMLAGGKVTRLRGAVFLLLYTGYIVFMIGRETFLKGQV